MNTKLEATPVTGDLGPAQQAAVDGPDGPDMKQFVCAVCDQRHYDLSHYFGGAESTRCMWCLKYNKKKPVAKTTEIVDSKS
jgi:hypothetical protein